MSVKPVRQPGPDHPITIEANPATVSVTAAGTRIAETRRALTLREAGHAPVHYVPLEDVAEGVLERSAHTSYCPYKGDATYYSIPAAGEAGENAVWEYRRPYPAVAEIEGHVAFYRDRVQVSERRG